MPVRAARWTIRILLEAFIVWAWFDFGRDSAPFGGFIRCDSPPGRGESAGEVARMRSQRLIAENPGRFQDLKETAEGMEPER